jgi:pimeloyl-ACP methyl ester carboxylesterase
MKGAIGPYILFIRSTCLAMKRFGAAVSAFSLLADIDKAMLPVRLLLALIIILVTVFGCAGPYKYPYSTDFPGAYLHPISTSPVVDGRKRFREIFCRLLTENPEYRGKADNCDDFLLRLSDEGPPDQRSEPVTDSNSRYRILVVPGLFNECFAGIALPFEETVELLSESGFKIDQLMVSGRSSCDRNAAQIAKVIENINLEGEEDLVLVGHSKGAVDILHFLVNHPEKARQVVAVVSIAGAINGSPLASKYGDTYTNLAGGIPYSWCEPGDRGAIDSLERSTRLSWLAANPLPQSVAYFSLVTMPRRENINLLLRIGYDTLAVFSPRNDGQLLSVDQIIPGATLLGYANADHWSVTLPLEDSWVSDTVRMPKRFPREIILQAILFYVVETLNRKQERNETAFYSN